MCSNDHLYDSPNQLEDCFALVNDKTAHPLVRIDAAIILGWKVQSNGFLPSNTIETLSHRSLMWISNDLYDGRPEVIGPKIDG